MTGAVRSAPERKSDALAHLEGDIDVWVATADERRAHLVPLSLAWDGTSVIVATPASSRTARNALATGEARLAAGTSRDVIMMDAVVTVVPCTRADEAVAWCYAARTGWDPRDEDDFVYLIATPRSIQAWRNLAEISGRTIMRDGRWTS